MSDCWDQAARVDLEEGLWLLVWIDFDVLIGYSFELEGYPHSLDEWASGDIVSGTNIESDL